MPSPNRLEALHDTDILPQVREQPETRRQHKVGDAEQNDAEDGHGKEQAQKHQEAPAEIVHALAHLERPQRVQHDGENHQQRKRRVHLAHHLATLPQPDVIHVVAGVLLRLDAHRPEPLDALAAAVRLLGRRVIVPLVRVNLHDAQGEHRHGQKLERVLERGAVRDFGE